MTAQASGAHAALMDGVYRHQRHIYDLTRKYYLLGRDTMIAGLDVPDGGTVLELGCGTGRNILHAARRYPRAVFSGLDISAAMLDTARNAPLGRDWRAVSPSPLPTHPRSTRPSSSAGPGSTACSSHTPCR